VLSISLSNIGKIIYLSSLWARLDVPRASIKDEFGILLIFFSMTIISAASFYALLINHRTRWLGQLLMWMGVAATSCYSLP